MKDTRGFSLVELMIALTLGALLSSVAVIAYLDARRAAFHDEQVSRLQENASYALRLLSREVQMAGFRAATVTNVVEPDSAADCDSVAWALNWSTPLQLVNDHRGADAPVTLDGHSLGCLARAAIVSGTDLLVVRRSAAQPAARRGVVADGLTMSSARVWYRRTEGVVAQEWLQARPRDIARLAATEPDSSFWEVSSRIYFVRAYSHTEGDGVPSLCIKTLAGGVVTTRCLVEGVEQLQMTYGLYENGDGVVNRYASAPTADQWRQAVVVHISLLMRSIDPLARPARSRSFTLASTTHETGETRYLHRLFSASVPLRNRPFVHG